VERLDDDPGSIVPDTAAVWGDLVRAWSTVEDRIKGRSEDPGDAS
jgi:hypothetical protein